MAYYKMLLMNLENTRTNLNHIPFLDIEASDAETERIHGLFFGKHLGDWTKASSVLGSNTGTPNFFNMSGRTVTHIGLPSIPRILQG